MQLVHPRQSLATFLRADMRGECLVKPASHLATCFARESLVGILRLGDVLFGRLAGINVGVFYVVLHGRTESCFSVQPLQRPRAFFRANMLDEHPMKPARLIAADFAGAYLARLYRLDDVRLGLDTRFSVGMFFIVHHNRSLRAAASPSTRRLDASAICLLCSVRRLFCSDCS